MEDQQHTYIFTEEERTYLLNCMALVGMMMMGSVPNMGLILALRGTVATTMHGLIAQMDPEGLAKAAKTVEDEEGNSHVQH